MWTRTGSWISYSRWALMRAWQDLIAVCTALVSKIRLADNEVVDNESVDYEKDRILDDRNGLVLDKSRRVEIVENGKRWVLGLKVVNVPLVLL